MTGAEQLFHNKRSGTFEEVGLTAGVAYDEDGHPFAGIGAASLLHSGWGAKFFDYDNDGWKDLFMGQSHVMDNIQLTQPDLRTWSRRFWFVM